MKISIKEREFRRYCRLMYTENCRERFDVGEAPYSSIEGYITKNEQFLRAKFNERKR